MLRGKKNYLVYNDTNQKVTKYKCMFCFINLRNTNIRHIISNIEAVVLINKYGIIIDIKNARYCVNCQNCYLKLINDGINVSKWFLIDYIMDPQQLLFCKQLKILLNRNDISSKLKNSVLNPLKYKKYTEIRLPFLNKNKFYQLCSLSPNQFAKIFSLIIERIHLTCMFLFYYLQFLRNKICFVE